MFGNSYFLLKMNIFKNENVNLVNLLNYVEQVKKNPSKGVHVLTLI